MAGSNTSAALPSASATSPTTSPAASSNQAASETSYTLGCDEPVIRGVVKAVRIDDRAKEDAGSSTVDGLQPDYQRLTDEQWSWIKHIVHAEEDPRRGRPRTDIRTIVDAALYKTRTGITWRELPAEFGSWQTALRRHRQLVASSQWDEITRTLAERDLPQ